MDVDQTALQEEKTRLLRRLAEIEVARLRADSPESHSHLPIADAAKMDDSKTA